jgi:hypothetical protein
VLADILGLTKVNYNACNFSDGLPVTIRFADKVGEVLTMGSAAGAERQPLQVLCLSKCRRELSDFDMSADALSISRHRWPRLVGKTGGCGRAV